MILSLLKNGFDVWTLIQVLISLPIIVFSLTIHECAHGYAAKKCGDHTAENLGRLDLNPLKHLDPIGTLCMLVCGIGWAKPVPINSRNFRNPRRDMAITAAAGPLTNLVIGFIFAVLAVICRVFITKSGITVNTEQNTYLLVIYWFLSMGCSMNIYLAVFNLLPIPPFDGSRILFIFLPPKYYFGIMKYERIIGIVLLILLWTGYLTAPISAAADFLENGFYKLLYLIPFFN